MVLKFGIGNDTECTSEKWSVYNSRHSFHCLTHSTPKTEKIIKDGTEWAGIISIQESLQILDPFSFYSYKVKHHPHSNE